MQDYLNILQKMKQSIIFYIKLLLLIEIIKRDYNYGFLIQLYIHQMNIHYGFIVIVMDLFKKLINLDQDMLLIN